MEQDNKTTPKAATIPAPSGGLVEWFTDEFIPQYGKIAAIGAIVLAIAIGALIYTFNSREGRALAENRELGQAYVLLNENRSDEAQAYLTGLVQRSKSNLVNAKANLMLGEIHFERGRYDEAIAAYSQVNLRGEAHSLLMSGALHGIAASHIQKQEFDKAIETLERFITQFKRKTGNPADRSAGREPADLSPVVPNALWKLALSYREVGNPEKARATAETLKKVYPNSREGYDATRFLAQI